MSCLALALAGCQGGGASPPSLNTGVALPPSVTTSGSLTPAGGAVSATLGTETVTVTAPAGALSGPGTLAVTVYQNGAAPKALSTAGRKVQTIGAGSVLLVEFTVTLTGATLVKPLAASLTTAGPATGSVIRLAGLGTAFDDVDTVTFAAGKASTDQNVLYSRMSLANGTFYAFYVEPTAQASAPPKPVITVTSPSGNTVGMLGTAQVVATEAQPNGFPYLDPLFAFAYQDATGSAPAATIDPHTGLLTTGAIDGSGTVTVTDTTAGRGNPTGTLAIGISSQRPGNTGDTFAFTGTLSTTTQQTNSNITTHPQVDAATVSLTSTVSQAQAVPPIGTGSQLVSTEIDTYPLQTITTKTTSVYGYTGPTAGKSTFAIVNSNATDSNGVQYGTIYGSSTSTPAFDNGILDVLPETTGSFGPNNAALTYNEADPANFGRTRTVAADGSYVESGHDAFGDVQTINAHADLSAFYDSNQFSGYNFTITKPSAGSPSTITITLKAGNTNRGSLTIPSWIPAGVSHPSTETDIDNGSVAYPAACSVPSKYGTSGNQIVETIQRYDPALGNAETMTTKTWVGAGVGPVCIQLTDVVNTFYDYTLQNGFVLFASGNGQPIQTTSLAETLTLQSASTQNGTVTQTAARGTSSVSAPRGTFATVALARARFEKTVRERTNFMRTQTFDRNSTFQGVKSL